MVSIGSSPSRARRRAIAPEAVQVMARKGAVDNVFGRRGPPLTKGFDETTEEPDPTVEDDKDSDDEDDENDDDIPISSIPETSSTTCTTPTISSTCTSSMTSPTTSPSTSLTTPATTSSAVSSQMTTSFQQTGGPLPTSSLPVSSTTVVVGESQTQETGTYGYDHGNDAPGGCGPHLPGLSDTDAKVAIAFGTIGAVGLIVALIWAAILIRRRRHRHGMDEVDPREYPSRIGRRMQFDFNFNFKFPSIPRLPFSFASPLERFHPPSPSPSPTPQGNIPSAMESAHIANKGNEAIQTAYRIDSREDDAVPQSWLDEKRYDPRYPLPILDPEPVQQASIRRSVVSWFKRSSRHQPLRLNSMRGANSRTSTASAAAGAAMRSGPGGIATESETMTNDPSVSRGSVSAEGDRSSFRGIEEIPPMPDLGLQGISFNNLNMTPTPENAADESVAMPQPAFTKEDAKAYYKSMWAEVSTPAVTERMSALSSWTDNTMRTSMQGGASRESVEQAGLSPPPGYINSSIKPNGAVRTSVNPVSTSMVVPIGPGSTGAQPMESEELYALYVQQQQQQQQQ